MTEPSDIIGVSGEGWVVVDNPSDIIGISGGGWNVFAGAADIIGISGGDWNIGSYAPSDIPAEAGGVGYSWFTVELTSAHVPPDVIEPPPKPVVLPVSPAKKLRRVRGEDRFPADFRVVETVTERFRAGFEVIAGDRYPATYDVVESGATTFAAQFHRSLRRRNADEEAVMALLMAEEEWE